MTNEEFRNKMIEYHKRYSASEIASILEVTKPTVEHWISGSNYPQVLARQSIVKKMDEQAQKDDELMAQIQAQLPQPLSQENMEKAKETFDSYIEEGGELGDLFNEDPADDDVMSFAEYLRSKDDDS